MLSFFIIEKLFYVFIFLSPHLCSDNRLERVINGQMNKEIIIMGSSRGARNLIASMLQDSFNLSAFNLSYPGSGIEFHEFILKSLLKFNEKPNTILLFLDEPQQLLKSETLKYRYDVLYPLVKYDHINDEMIRREQKNILSNYFALARINKKNFDLRTNNIPEYGTILKCGSMPIDNPTQKGDFTFKTFNNPYDTLSELSEKTASFLSFQDICLASNIKLIMVFSPNFRKENNEFEMRMRSLTHPNFTFIKYDTKNPIYTDKNYYFDETHLRTKGAIIFTNDIIKNLKKPLGNHLNYN